MMFATPQISLPVVGSDDTLFVRRIFCVGRNYADHAREMGDEVDREEPIYFTKSAHAVCQSGQTIAYPPGTQDCHFEMEFVVVIGREGRRIPTEQALEHVFGYACGIDLTRRDLQARAKDKRRPWDLGKDFENSAILGAVTQAVEFGDPRDQTIRLWHQERLAQEARLDDMIWSVPDILSDLSKYYTLMPGDLVFTGTPAGVGPVVSGETLRGEVTGLAPVEVSFCAPL